MKTKKKLLSFLLVLVLIITIIPAAFADSSKSRVYDDEGLFDDFDIELLNGQLAELSSTYGIDVAIVTAEDFGSSSAEEYADDYYDEHEIGQGEHRDGILLLISSGERKWHISTSGYGIFAFPDAYIDEMADEFVPYMSEGDWYGAAHSFIESCGPILARALDDPSGTTPGNFDPDDFDNDYNSDYEPITDTDGSYTDSSDYEHLPLGFYPMWFGIALFIGILAALIVLAVMKSGMKTVHMQPSASDYVRKGSFDLKESRDTYLYMTVTRTAKPKKNDKDDDSFHHGGFGSGGNFSSTHTSSGGSTHGGHGGSF